MNMKRILVFIMTLAMIVSACAPAIHAFDGVIDGEHNHESSKGNLNYVSIGDSMTNGYGFDGYAQGTDDHDFANGVGTYGNGSYALQFENYLKGLGYDVDHTKLAVSALRAEDLLYLLGGRDEPADDWFDEVLYYSGMTAEELMVKYQEAVKGADVITLGIGNASFGAFMLSRVTSTIGVMGGAPEVYEDYTLENALELLEDEEAKSVVIKVYNKLFDQLANYLSAEMIEQFSIEAVCDVVAYTVAGFMINYAKSIDKIVELNEKDNLEIMLVGLMNTTYGMEIKISETRSIPFGKLMDEVFGLLNTYIATYPTTKQLAGEFDGVTFYYADEKEPLFIVNALDDLAEAGWTNIDNGRLSADIIRSRTIRTYNGTLRSMIGAAFAQGVNAVIPGMVEAAVMQGYRDYLATEQAEVLEMLEIDVYALNDAEFLDLLVTFGVIDGYYADVEANTNAMLITDYAGFLPEITLDDVKAYNGASWTNAAFFMEEADRKTLSVAVYLAIEDAIIKSIDVNEIPMDGVMAIAGDLSGLFADFAPDTTTPDAVRATLGEFMSSETMLPLVKIFAIFKIGDGMCVHTTPAGHDKVYAAIVKSYEEGWTAKKETIESVTYYVENYYAEAYGVAYLLAQKGGYIDLSIKAIDKVINRIEVVDLSDNKMTPAFRVDLQRELDATVNTLEELKAILEIDQTEDVPGLIKAIRGLKDDLKIHAKNIYNLCEQLGIDALTYAIIPLLKEIIQIIEEEIIPAIIAFVEYVVDRIVDFVGEILGEIADELRELIKLIIKVQLLLGKTIRDIINIVVFVYDLLVDIFGSIQNALIIAIKLAILIFNFLDSHKNIAKYAYDLFCEIVALIVKVYGETKDVLATAEAVWLYSLRVLAGLKNKFEASIDGATNGNYVITEDSYYVALGYFYEVEDLANMLYLGEKYAWFGLDEDYTAEIGKADLITVKFNNGEFEAFAMEQMIGAIATIIRSNETLMQYYGMYQEEIDATLADYGLDINAQVIDVDWTKYLDEETYAILSERFAVLKEKLVEGGIPAVYELDVTPMLEEYLIGTEIERVVLDIPVAAIVAYAIESALYGYVETLNRVQTTLETVYALAPDATVVITGINNPLDMYAALIGLAYPDALDYFDTLNDVVELLNVPLYACAVAREKTIFVFEESADAVYEALNAVCAHAYDDDCVDTTCNICGFVRVAPGHNYVNYVSNNNAACEKNATETGTCSKCGATDTREIPNSALGHDYKWEVAKEATEEEEGREDYKCSRCGHVSDSKVIPAIGKTPVVVGNDKNVIRIVAIVIACIAAACGIGALAYWFFVKRKETAPKTPAPKA